LYYKHAVTLKDPQIKANQIKYPMTYHSLKSV